MVASAHRWNKERASPSERDRPALRLCQGRRRAQWVWRDPSCRNVRNHEAAGPRTRDRRGVADAPTTACRSANSATSAGDVETVQDLGWFGGHRPCPLRRRFAAGQERRQDQERGDGSRIALLIARVQDELELVDAGGSCVLDAERTGDRPHGDGNTMAWPSEIAERARSETIMISGIWSGTRRERQAHWREVRRRMAASSKHAPHSAIQAPVRIRAPLIGVVAKAVKALSSCARGSSGVRRDRARMSRAALVALRVS